MSDKICAKCGTWIPAGKYCPECGQQLYPDIGQTVWLDYANPPKSLKPCRQSKFDVWNGKPTKEA